jgi:DNA repair protein RecN (Recombination protein N)
VEFSELETLSSLGKDKMDWLLKANRGSRFQSLEKAASGGEQSRIILAIKSIMAKYQHQPTIVFDEIDTGVSGDIAKKMGVVMQELAEKRQVISITHLPQIAAKGQHHFKVYKEHSKGVTTTNIKKLSETDRIAELAGMLGGQEQSESARAHAESLMKSTT